MVTYLSEEEQYKDILNNEEISKIKDPVLQEIRSRYWHLRHEAFIDEHNISDIELDSILEKLKKKEKQEIDQYRKSISSNNIK